MLPSALSKKSWEILFSYILLAAGIVQEHLFTYGQSLTISVFVFIAAAIFWAISWQLLIAMRYIFLYLD
jgi:hypothetical protein